VSDAAELWIAPLRTDSSVFSRLLNVDSDGDEVTSAGRLFHMRAAATGNTRSLTVDRRVTGKTNVLVDAERRDRRALIKQYMYLCCIFMCKLIKY